jgi:superoxide dismutase
MADRASDMPYPYEAREPHVGAATMQLHRDKHHQAYVDNITAAGWGRRDLRRGGLDSSSAGVKTTNSMSRRP